jgi:ribosomal protein S26
VASKFQGNEAPVYDMYEKLNTHHASTCLQIAIHTRIVHL